jgi:cytochrome P450
MASDVDPGEIDLVGRAGAELTEHFDSRFNSLRFFLPDFLPTPGNLRMRAAVRRLDRIIYRLIGERRASPKPGEDVISMLLGQRGEDGRRLNDREVRDEVMTLFLAGHETTALALTWTLYLLGRHSDVERRLRAELAEVLAGGRPPTVADLPRLKFTEAVILESLRLYPPAYAVSREAVRPTEIGGRKIGRRTIAFVSVYAAHRNREHFPDPDEFRPERWLDGLAGSLPRGAYIPFAEGPRKCIGASFAMQEAVLVLATIASRARLTPETSRDVVPVPAVTLRPAEPVRMVVAKT